MRKALLPLVLLTVSAGLLWDGVSAESRARRPARARPAAVKPSPNQRLIVQDLPPKPAVKGVKIVAPARRWGRYSGTSRRSQPLYLLDGPDGSKTIKLRVGLVMNVLQRGPKFTKVETGGGIRVSGWVPNVVLGLRVQGTAKLYSRPGGPSFGEVGMGMLVHVEKEMGAYARVQVMGYVPLRCFMRRKDLDVKATGYKSMPRRYPGGSAMVLSAGPVHSKSGGPAVGQALDEGRIYRIRVLGRWSQIAWYDYSRVHAQVWVPTTRLRWGSYPHYGNGYNRYNCKPGTSGSQVALASFKLYAARDDAWPTIRVMPNARFNVIKDRDGWVKITSHSCLTFTGYAPDRPGDWTPTHLYRK